MKRIIFRKWFFPLVIIGVGIFMFVILIPQLNATGFTAKELLTDETVANGSFHQNVTVYVAEENSLLCGQLTANDENKGNGAVQCGSLTKSTLLEPGANGLPVGPANGLLIQGPEQP